MTECQCSDRMVNVAFLKLGLCEGQMGTGDVFLNALFMRKASLSYLVSY